MFLISGEFHEFGVAPYHSAVCDTTLGYGDLVVLSPKWRLLGPLEAANGILMFGVASRDDFYPHSTVDSGEVCRSQRLRSSACRRLVKSRINDLGATSELPHLW